MKVTVPIFGFTGTLTSFLKLIVSLKNNTMPNNNATPTPETYQPINYEQALQQLQCMGEYHPQFRDVNIELCASLIKGRFVQHMFGYIYLQSNDYICSGLVYSEADMFANLQNRLDVILKPAGLKEVA